MIDLSSIPNDLQGNALRRVLENYQNSLKGVEEDVNNVAENVSDIEKEIINPDLPISTPFTFETGMLNSPALTSAASGAAGGAAAGGVPGALLGGALGVASSLLGGLFGNHNTNKINQNELSYHARTESI